MHTGSDGEEAPFFTLDGLQVICSPPDPVVEDTGRYVIIKKLAVGGMADVFLARDEAATPPRLVVLKRLLAELRSQSEAVTMFLDESDLAVKLAHPNVVRALDRGSTSQGPFLVLEYLAGFDLDLVLDRLRERGATMPWDLSVRIIGATARGMAYAHGVTGADGKPLNLVHRDLTPSNIFLTFDGLVKVLDFGIARAKERRTRTSTGLLKGKPRYLAPEQIQGGQVDGRVDQFALGAALFESLTLRPLFQGSNELAVIHAILEPKRPSLAQMRPDIPASLDVIFRRMTAPLPEDRFDSMAEVAEALEAVLPAADWRPDLASFMRQHFGADFEAHATLMGRLASASTSELGTLVERSESRSSHDEEQPPAKTVIKTVGRLRAEARRTAPSLDDSVAVPEPPTDVGAPGSAPLRLPGEEVGPIELPIGSGPGVEESLGGPTARLGRIPLALAIVLLVGLGAWSLGRFRKPPPAPTGSLVVRSTPPGATLWLDGVLQQGVTPLALKDLSPGPHQVTLRHPDAEEQSVTAEVLVGSANTVEVGLAGKEGTIGFVVTPESAVALLDGAIVALDAGVGRSGPLTAGVHEVVVRALGYQQKVLSIEVRDGAHETTTIALDPEP